MVQNYFLLNIAVHIIIGKQGWMFGPVTRNVLILCTGHFIGYFEYNSRYISETLVQQ